MLNHCKSFVNPLKRSFVSNSKLNFAASNSVHTHAASTSFRSFSVDLNEAYSPTAHRSQHKHIAITGANGTIGSVVYTKLKETGEYQLFPFVHRRKPHSPPEAMEIDFANSSAAEREVFRHADVVIHLAATADSKAGWDEVLQKNIIACRNVFEACKISGVPRLIFASSNHVNTGRMLYQLGTNNPSVGGGQDLKGRGPYKETDSYDPDSIHGVSKTFGEQLAYHYAVTTRMEVICLRIGWVCPQDNPLEILKDEPAERQRHLKSLYLSHRDLTEIVKRLIDLDMKSYPIPFEVLNCTSQNKFPLLDLSHMKQITGYEPRDGL